MISLEIFSNICILFLRFYHYFKLQIDELKKEGKPMPKDIEEVNNLVSENYPDFIKRNNTYLVEKVRKRLNYSEEYVNINESKKMHRNLKFRIPTWKF
jgi:hypothetical protein